jgi:hypothetical protein
MATEKVKIVISAVNTTQAAFNKVTRSLRSISTASLNMAKSVARGAAMAAAAVAAMGFALSKQTEKIDNVAKTARKLGTTVSTLQELQYAAELTGVSSTTLDMAMQRLTRRVSEAAGGFGEAKGALRELGLNAAKLEKMPLDKQMEALADAFEGVDSQADKVRLSMKLFDSEGVALVNTLGAGSQGLRDMAQEARDLGITLTDIEAARFEDMNDAITKMKFAASASTTVFVSELLPAIEGLFTGFNDAGYGADTFKKRAVGAAHGVMSAFGFVLDVIHNLKLAFHVLSSVAMTQAEFIVNGLRLMMGGITATYNAMAGVLQIPLMNNPMEDFAKQMVVGAAEARIAFRALRDEGLPSEAIARYLAEYEKMGSGVVAVNAGIGNSVRKLTEFEKIRAWGQAQQTKLQETQAVTITNAFAQQTADIAAYSKKGFAIDKGVRVAQAIMNTYQGATLALATYPGPLGIALAATTVAAGMANVAKISSQQFQGSFDGGGFTGMGSRTGGMDGKGGFPAILHPNETVIDHTKGQGAGMTVNVNISANDTKGFDELLYKRRGQLVNIINQAINNHGRASLA